MKASHSAPGAPPKGRLLVGGTIFVVGFLAPLLVPLVAASDLPVAWKTGLSGLLLVGIPEIFMVIAAAVLGKPGFEYLKSRLLAALRGLRPAGGTTRARHRIGVVLFLIPVLFGWLAPYIGSHIPAYADHQLMVGFAGDGLLIIGLFVLGGDFWDKLGALFAYGSGES